MSTDPAYTKRLAEKQSVWWKSLLDVQTPYRWHIKYLNLGVTLEIGCGIGRNLMHLRDSVGIDPNETSIEVARSRGLTAYTPDEFLKSSYYVKGNYDSFLLAHVAEHIGQDETVNLITRYLELLKPNGRLVLITPQISGYKSDITHVEYIDFSKQRKIIDALGFEVLNSYSFPFPSVIGKIFLYNEFVTIGKNKQENSMKSNE